MPATNRRPQFDRRASEKTSMNNGSYLEGMVDVATQSNGSHDSNIQYLYSLRTRCIRIYRIYKHDVRLLANITRSRFPTQRWRNRRNRCAMCAVVIPFCAPPNGNAHTQKNNNWYDYIVTRVTHKKTSVHPTACHVAHSVVFVISYARRGIARRKDQLVARKKTSTHINIDGAPKEFR